MIASEQKRGCTVVCLPQILHIQVVRCLAPSLLHFLRPQACPLVVLRLQALQRLGERMGLCQPCLRYVLLLVAIRILVLVPQEYQVEYQGPELEWLIGRALFLSQGFLLDALALPSEWEFQWIT